MQMIQALRPSSEHLIIAFECLLIANSGITLGVVAKQFDDLGRISSMMLSLRNPSDSHS